MRISLVTSGRFHLLDLARELARLGHDIAFLSALPRWRATAHGLAAADHRWLGPRASLALVGDNRTGLTRALIRAATGDSSDAVDRAATRRLGVSDAVIAMSGMSSRVLTRARTIGALAVVERSSVHILDQRAVLAAKDLVPPEAVDRELASYDASDLVVVPAQHVADSFQRNGFPTERLRINRFGVDLDAFTPTPAPDGPPTILAVGAWSWQKGSDVLTEAWRAVGGEVRLVHIGPVIDVELPRDRGFTHIGPVPQRALPSMYAKADVLALPSRQDGLALVQLQALATGVPVVCSDRTGGADLVEVAVPDAVRVVAAEDPDALRRALEAALSARPPASSTRDLLGTRRGELSWAAYAERYEAILRS